MKNGKFLLWMYNEIQSYCQDGFVVGKVFFYKECIKVELISKSSKKAMLTLNEQRNTIFKWT